VRYKLNFDVTFDPSLVDTICEWANALELMLVQRYVLLKSDPICKVISKSFGISGFHWTKNYSLDLTEEPLNVRPEVMEVLLEVVSVHAELTSYFGNTARDDRSPVRRGMAMIVDAVIIAFIQAHRVPDEYSQDGAWQLLVDLEFVEWVLNCFMSLNSRESLQDVVHFAQNMAQIKGGKSRRDDVKKGKERILSETKRSTEYIWGGVRDSKNISS